MSTQNSDIDQTEINSTIIQIAEFAQENPIVVKAAQLGVVAAITAINPAAGGLIFLGRVTIWGIRNAIREGGAEEGFEDWHN